MSKQSLPLLAVCGSVAKDINITPSSRSESPGGAAFFVANAAALYINDVGLVTKLGNDFDLNLFHKNILHDGIHVSESNKTAVSTQTYFDESDLTNRDISFDLGSINDMNYDNIPKSWFSSLQYFHVGTMPPTLQEKFVNSLVKLNPDIKISIDTDNIFLQDEKTLKQIEKLVLQTDIVFLNRLESHALAHVIDKHPFVISKKDKDGAEIISYGKVIASSKAPKVKAVDATGAGDFFAGTFLAHKVLGDGDEDSLIAAIQQASELVKKEGMDHLSA